MEFCHFRIWSFVTSGNGVLSLLEIEFCHFQKWSFVASGKLNFFLKHKILYDYEVFWSISLILCHGLTTNPWTPFSKPELRIQNLQKNRFSIKKNMVVGFFSRSDKTLKLAKGVVGWLFFVTVRSHQQPMHGCNLESSLLLNFFIRKDFILQSRRA